MVHFWASEVTETKAAVVKVPEGFVLNVCNATLASDAASVVSLGLETTQMDRKAWKGVVAHLGAAAHAHQVKLDLVFGATPQVKFYVAKGSGKVNLTGYFQPGPPADLFESAPAATAASSAKPTQQSSKKRARDEPVMWDQDASTSDSDDNGAAEPKPKPQSKTPTTPNKPAGQQQQQQQQKPKKPQQPAPAVANGSSAASSDSASASKKKHRKKNKKPSA